jgi:hypothetical protein
MPEGLSTPEVAKQIGEHVEHAAGGDRGAGRDRIATIVEAFLLAVVAVLAAYSGYASAKWSTESRLDLARASTARTEASTANSHADTNRNFDASTFNTWFSAKVAGSESAMAIAERRFRPAFRVAFDAWLATDPDTNPHAPPGPTYMPQYKQPELQQAAVLNTKATRAFNDGSTAAGHSDDYVLTTVYLATVLFLVAISGHFSLLGARYGLMIVGVIILGFAVSRLLTLPGPS